MILGKKPIGKKPTGKKTQKKFHRKNAHKEKCPQGKIPTRKNAHKYDSFKIVTGMSVFVRNRAMRKGILRSQKSWKKKKTIWTMTEETKKYEKSEQWNEETAKSIMHAQIISLSVEGFYSC